jgi:hypothetical protein
MLKEEDEGWKSRLRISMKVLHHLFNQGRFCNAKHYCCCESEAEKAKSKGQPFFRTANQVPVSLSQSPHLYQPALCE